MSKTEEILKKHLSELFGKDIEPVDGLIIDVKTVRKVISECTSELEKEIQELRDESDEKLLKFIDWFGSWQTDKNVSDYGINDILKEFKALNK